MANDFNEAESSITLTALSLLPPRSTNGSPFSAWWIALLAAAARGVKVRIKIAASTPAHPATLRNNRVAIEAHAAGMIVDLVPGARLLHAKTARIDSSLSWVGSGNFTAAAAHHNFEAWLRDSTVETASALDNFHAGLP
jgi:phosphatidylserine/phosphatidylglycerophosphate/cardiolipin synthase-like enzyme